MPITALIATGIGTALAGAGVGAATAGVIGSIAAPAVLGAGVGALTSAISGGKVGKGALYGGLGGLALGGAGALWPETMGALGLGPGMATMGADGNWIPGPGGFASSGGGGGALSQAGGILGGNNPLDLGVEDWSEPSQGGGGFLSNIGRALNTTNPTGEEKGGFNWTRALLGLAGGALSSGGGASLPDIDRGPYYDAPLATGYINRQPNPDYRPRSNDWYTYGQTPGNPQFFTNNQVNFPRMARGGALSAEARGPSPRPMSTFESASGDRFVVGPGDGQSDSVDAKLSAGEYVIDAASVARLGNGSNEAGAKKLDAWRRRLARDTTGSKRVIPRKAKSPDSYLAATGGRR